MKRISLILITVIAFYANTTILAMNQSSKSKKLRDALVKGDLKGVKLYLKNNKDINLSYYPNGTALIQAVIYNKPNLVKFLLQKPEIDVNAIRLADKGETALMLAAYYNRPEIVKLLLQHPNINVNKQNEHGFTALMWAAQGGHEKIVNLLLAHPKINVKVEDDKGNNAYKFALKAGHKDIASTIKKKKMIKNKLLK